jgi:2-polyprenyl-3-methyl-5-hydroxy-6-metoxy-1,4-benzoquinol methylase
LDLGGIPIVHRFLQDKNQKNEYTHLIAVHICQNCGMVWILNPIKSEELYRDYNFWFSDWKPQSHVYDEIKLIERHIQKDDLVLEIGCNDGMFLSEMKDRGFIRLIGVKPNQICFQRATEKGLHLYNDFFDATMAEDILQQHGKAQFIVIWQVMEHI